MNSLLALFKGLARAFDESLLARLQRGCAAGTAAAAGAAGETSILSAAGRTQPLKGFP